MLQVIPWCSKWPGALSDPLSGALSEPLSHYLQHLVDNISYFFFLLLLLLLLSARYRSWNRTLLFPGALPLAGFGEYIYICIYIYTRCITLYPITSQYIYIYIQIFHHLPGIYAFYANIRWLYIHSIWFIHNNPNISTKIVEDTYIPITIRLLYIPIVFPSYPIKVAFFPPHFLGSAEVMDSFRRSPRISGKDQSPETMPSRCRETVFFIIKNDGIVQWGYSNSILNCHFYISFENQT